MDSADLDGSEFGSNNDNDLTLLASTNQTEMSEVIHRISEFFSRRGNMSRFVTIVALDEISYQLL